MGQFTYSMELFCKFVELYLLHNVFKYSIISGRMSTMDEVCTSNKIGGLNVTTD